MLVVGSAHACCSAITGGKSPYQRLSKESIGALVRVPVYHIFRADSLHLRVDDVILDYCVQAMYKVTRARSHALLRIPHVCDRPRPLRNWPWCAAILAASAPRLLRNVLPGSATGPCVMPNFPAESAYAVRTGGSSFGSQLSLHLPMCLLHQQLHVIGE